jgi:hypothetical protein
MSFDDDSRDKTITVSWNPAEDVMAAVLDAQEAAARARQEIGWGENGAIHELADAVTRLSDAVVTMVEGLTAASWRNAKEKENT